ncbi:LptA/OstA family protein [Methylopila sp. M107]|uniref:LptA/OstA family protein n=1 Tax=Methylopila sp. M107 TaxID=1101190 RepID=UPI0012DCE768|nr:LptA/OstA family protein [Methylopila sp. M107]
MRLILAALAVLAVPSAVQAQQQNQGAVTSAFSGFSTKSDDPVNVEADNLEVRDQDQSAVFSGKVVLKQGGSIVNARKLTIYYYQKGQTPAAKTDGSPKQGETAGGAAKPETGRSIRRMEAEGDVVVTQRNQRATGARGVFDVESNKVELTGGVVVSQDDNVIKGDRLRVDLTTQTSRVEGGGSGRVQGVFTPKQQPTR